MRLLGTIDDEKKGRGFSEFLTAQGIENLFEVSTETDWGKDTYGDRHNHLWVVDENQLEEAKSLFEEFKANPEDSRFKLHPHSIKEFLESRHPHKKAGSLGRPSKASSSRQPAWQAQSMGPVTLLLLLTCALLFLWKEMGVSGGRFASPVPTAAIERNLLYDYPAAFEWLAQASSPQEVQSSEVGGEEFAWRPGTEDLPAFWSGAYDKIVLYAQGREDQVDWRQPMWEKLRQGEVWRLFSPVLLHSDIFHFFFNMLWLLVLGKQLELHLGPWRYIFFMAIAAIVSNTAQYLMSGPNFLGFSGVLCAMFAFIYVRQKIAPWEGYQLQQTTIVFLSLFILAMVGIQLFSFFTEVWWYQPLTPRIANSAHLAGILVGYGLGHLSYFAWDQER